MNDQGKKAAKDLFYRYTGDHGLMYHDGVFNEYETFKITSHEEHEWADELAKLLIKKMEENFIVNAEFHKLINVIKTYKLYSYFFSLFELVTKKCKTADNFTALLASELIIDTSSFFLKENVIDHNVLKEISREIYKIIDTFPHDLYSVNKYYKTSGFIPYSFSTDAIKNRIECLKKNCQILF